MTPPPPPLDQDTQGGRGWFDRYSRKRKPVKEHLLLRQVSLFFPPPKLVSHWINFAENKAKRKKGKQAMVTHTNTHSLSLSLHPLSLSLSLSLSLFVSLCADDKGQEVPTPAED